MGQQSGQGVHPAEAGRLFSAAQRCAQAQVRVGQTGGTVCGEEVPSHPAVDPDSLERLQNQFSHSSHQRRVHARPLLGDVELVHDQQASWTQVASESLQRFDGVAEMHEHGPADDRIELPVEVEGVEVRLGEFDLLPMSQPVAGPVECFGITVDGEHLSVGTDEIGGDGGNVSGTGADVEHAHARSDSRFDVQLPGQWVEHDRLVAQSGVFALGLAEDVSILFLHGSDRRDTGRTGARDRRTSEPCTGTGRAASATLCVGHAGPALAILCAHRAGRLGAGMPVPTTSLS